MLMMLALRLFRSVQVLKGNPADADDARPAVRPGFGGKSS